MVASLQLSRGRDSESALETLLFSSHFRDNGGMCRTQGRRCDAKWDDAHRERYNARRRIVRNGEKAQAARADGRDSKAAYYEGLVESSAAKEQELDSAIRAHETASAGGDGGRQSRCSECGQFLGSDHPCPGAAFRDSAIREEDGNLSVVHHGSATAFDSWDPEFTGTGNDSWGSGFYFTNDESRAHGYGEHVKSVVLNIQNPIVVDGLSTSNLDDIHFNAKQSEAILRRHPDIYRQPNDEDEMNPLGDYSAEFWDKEEWSEGEMNSMISKVSKDYFSDASWSNLEGVFPGGHSAEFRYGVQEATGHDGVVADFEDEGRHTIAWFPEQVHEVGNTSNSGNASVGGVATDQAPGEDEGTKRCTQCGRWVGSSHDCPQKHELESLQEDSAEWRNSWSKDEDRAFDTYGGIEHEEINAKLRQGQPLSAQEATVVRDIDSALARAPRADHERTLYRSFSLAERRGDAPVDEWVETNLPQGEVVSFDAYTSTTPNNAVSEEFSGAMSEYTDSGVVMEVHTAQSGYTGDSAESEVLLRRGSRFEVVSNEETLEMNGKKFRKVVVREASADPVIAAHPLASRDSGPEEVEFVRNPISSTAHVSGNDFGQDIEPSGRYITKLDGFVPEGWESGTVRFEKPLYIHFGEGGLYSDGDNWKRRLSGYYGGKTGSALSDAVRADGYDGIVTHDKYGTSEIVDLTSKR